MVNNMDCVPRSWVKLWIVLEKPIERSLVAIASRYTSALRSGLPTCCVRYARTVSFARSNGTAMKQTYVLCVCVLTSLCLHYDFTYVRTLLKHAQPIDSLPMHENA